jgi:hypothetical protein
MPSALTFVLVVILTMTGTFGSQGCRVDAQIVPAILLIAGERSVSQIVQSRRRSSLPDRRRSRLEQGEEREHSADIPRYVVAVIHNGPRSADSLSTAAGSLATDPWRSGIVVSGRWSR